ncbi:MAG: hydroxyacid dehydrogenase [Microbacterium sp.]|jgi:phosphoglycerate dehydrogenase-like enzyme|nr:hydroxyacid dehydrogenase [Microbacterium sp.]
MAAHRPHVLLAMSTDAAQTVFDDRRLARLGALAELAHDAPVTDFDLLPDEVLSEIEVLVTSWGAPELDAARLARLPRLRAVFHAAGSVRPIVTDEFWDRGILITSAADANAVPVAEFAFAAIVLAGKRAFLHVREPGFRPENGLHDYAGIGNVDRTIGIVGYSRIGRRVVEMLRMLDVRVLVADPFADAADVASAGAELVPLAELLPQADVLSLHAPALPETHHMIGAAELAALPGGATVINTARGALLDHDALLAECRTGRLDAVLDVTDPEPLPADSELLRLPNVAITPHIAGSLGTELRRLADSALDELEAFASGAAPRHPVTASEMATTA